MHSGMTGRGELWFRASNNDAGSAGNHFRRRFCSLLAAVNSRQKRPLENLPDSVRRRIQDLWFKGQFTAEQFIQQILQWWFSRIPRRMKFLPAFTTASPLLHGDRIATSRGIFMPHLTRQRSKCIISSNYSIYHFKDKKEARENADWYVQKRFLLLRIFLSSLRSRLGAIGVFCEVWISIGIFLLDDTSRTADPRAGGPFLLITRICILYQM